MQPISIAILSLAATLPSLETLQNEVRCHEIAFSQAAEQRDAERFTGFIDADARFVGAGVLRGPDAIREGWDAFFAADGPAIKWRPRIIEVLDSGELALSRGPYRVTLTDDDGVESENWGTFNSVWRRQADGSWKVLFDAGSAAAAPPSDDVRALLDDDAGCP